MLNDLEQLFLQDPNIVVALAVATATVVGLLIFYYLLRTLKKQDETDPYQAFLDEEYKLAKSNEIKETVVLELPPPVVPELVNVVVKPAKKKAAKKKAAKKKTVAKAKKANNTSA